MTALKRRARDLLLVLRLGVPQQRLQHLRAAQLALELRACEDLLLRVDLAKRVQEQTAAQCFNYNFQCNVDYQCNLSGALFGPALQGGSSE